VLSAAPGKFAKKNKCDIMNITVSTEIKNTIKITKRSVSLFYLQIAVTIKNSLNGQNGRLMLKLGL